MRWGGWVAPLLLLALAVTVGESAGAGDARIPDVVARLAVLERPGSAATAVALAFPRGSGDDPDGMAGAAHLLATALEEEAALRLNRGAALVRIQAQRDRFQVALVAAPQDAWESYRTLSSVLFGTPVSQEAVERARTRIVSQLNFQQGSPVTEFEVEALRAVFGIGHPWARSEKGTLQEVAAIPVGRLQGLQAEWLRPGQAAAAVVGPVQGLHEVWSYLREEGASPPPPPSAAAPEPAADTLPAPGTPPEADSLPGPGPVPGATPVPETEPSPQPPAPPAEPGSLPWTTPERLVLEREVISSWVAVAYPAPPGAPRTALEFLAYEIQESLNTIPPDPGLFAATARVESAPEGPILIVTAAVLPDAAEAWERRITRTVDRVVEGGLDPAFVQLRRRRFAGTTLLAEAHPEEEALRVAEDLLRNGEVRELAGELLRLRVPDLTGAAALLGPPRILIYGPPPPR